MEHAQKTVEANAPSEEQEEEAEEEEEDDNEEEIKRLSLLLVGRRILRILDKMLSIANDNKNLESIVHSICDGNGTMNTIENLSYHEFNDYGVLEDVKPFALNILKIVYHTKIKSNDPEKQLEALRYFRKKISTEISTNLIVSDKAPLVLVQTVAQSSSRRYRYLIGVGAVPAIIRLLSSSSNKALATIAALALGSIAKDSGENRDVVIECGALPVLLKVIDSSHEPSDTYIAALWSLSGRTLRLPIE
eukprot:gene1804-1930_t